MRCRTDPTPRTVRWMKSGLLCAMFAFAGCTGSEALESGDCPGTPRAVTLDPVAPVFNGLLVVEFQSDAAPSGVDVQRHSAARGLWEQSYGPLGQKDDGTYTVQVRPQVAEADADDPIKIRVRSTLLGCPPSSWAETDGVTLGDPVTGTTWIGTFGPGTVTAQLNVSVLSGAGTSVGPYRIATTPPLRQTVTFGAGGVFDETLEVGFESATPGDVYNGCRFKLAYRGTWVATYGDDSRVAVFGRRFVSLAGSTCTNPPIADIAPALAGTLSDDVLSTSSIDYTGLLENPRAAPEWQAYNLLAQTFQSAISALSDHTGPDMTSIDGYVSVFRPTYVKQ